MITCLAAEAVAGYAGRFDVSSCTRKLWREERRIGSPNDVGITSLGPRPERPHGRAADPVLDAMRALLTSAMLELYGAQICWLPDRGYVLLNGSVSRAWNWGGGRSQPESVGMLRRALALDEDFRRLPDFGGRVTGVAYRGGHMLYSRADSRRAFLVEARILNAAAEEDEGGAARCRDAGASGGHGACVAE